MMKGADPPAGGPGLQVVIAAQPDAVDVQFWRCAGCDSSLQRWLARKMARYVIDPSVALHLAQNEVVVPGQHRLVAPTLLRSQLLSMLFQTVQRGEMSKADAERHLDYVRGLRIRLLGDRVLQAVAWKVADQLGLADTLDAEYVALTQLQADALITLNPQLSTAAKDLVALAPIDVLT